MKSFLLILIFLATTTLTFSRSAYKVENNDIYIQLEGIGVKSKILKIELWSESVVRVRSSMHENFSINSRLIGERSTEKIKFKVAYAQHNIEVATTNLFISIAEDGTVRLLSRDGRKLMVESDRSYQASEFQEDAFKITQSFYLNRNEHIFGFGQDNESSRFNLRNQSFEIKQDNASIATPVFFSEKGYAFIWDNYSPTKYTDAPSGLVLTSDIADEISFFFISGPEWSSITSEIRAISGNVPLLPKWAFAFHLNPNAYETDEEFNVALKKYQSLNIPVEKNKVDNQLYIKEKELTASADVSKIKNAFAYSELKEQYAQTKGESTNRVVIPTHTNIPGIQKYGTFLTSGEISGTWNSLKNQITAGINSTFTGQPYWSTTIGGTNETINPELLVRWYQFAVFTPIFQGALNGDIWEIGTDDKYTKAVEQSIKLRYKLLPYIYSTASTINDNNDNIMRSLLSDFQKDENTHTIDNQYLFGKSLMVCPITEEGMQQINVHLPSEIKWFDFYTGKSYNDLQDLTINVSLDLIPVFVKGGSIIPISTIEDNNSENLNSILEIRVYPGADGEFTLYEDENDGLAYQDGKFSKINFAYSNKSKSLTIGAIEGEFTGMINERLLRIKLVLEKNGTDSSSVQDITYKGKKVKVKFD